MTSTVYISWPEKSRVVILASLRHVGQFVVLRPRDLGEVLVLLACGGEPIEEVAFCEIGNDPDERPDEPEPPPDSRRNAGRSGTGVRR